LKAPEQSQTGGWACDVSEQIQRAGKSRARLAELAAHLDRTEGSVAHVHDHVADRDPHRAALYPEPPKMPARPRGAREIQCNAAG
jgi:hypothetical protein